MPERVRELIYVSHATNTGLIASNAAIADIVAASRVHNARDNNTGALLFGDHRFAQVLEGPDEAVERTFARIRLDMRHHDLLLLAVGTIAQRSYGAWSMASATTGDDGETSASRLRQAFADPKKISGPAIRDLIQKCVAKNQLW